MDGRRRIAQSLDYKLRGEENFQRRQYTSGLNVANKQKIVWKDFTTITRVLLSPWRGLGTILSVLFLLSCIISGFVVGGHYENIQEYEGGLTNILARSVGFGINHIAISGLKDIKEEEVLNLAAIARGISLPFINPDLIKTKLLTNPFIADAKVTKLYPDHLFIQISERIPFALWQQDGKIFVISEDGTPIRPLDDPRFLTLPHVVGEEANLHTNEFINILRSAPEIRSRVRAGIFVSKRRWTLKLDNGLEIYLPEIAPEEAIKKFSNLEQKDEITKKAILAVDLRLNDRVVMRLTEEAASARNDLLQQKIKKLGSKA